MGEKNNVVLKDFLERIVYFNCCAMFPLGIFWPILLFLSLTSFLLSDHSLSHSCAQNITPKAISNQSILGHGWMDILAIKLTTDFISFFVVFVLFDLYPTIVFQIYFFICTLLGIFISLLTWAVRKNVGTEHL